MNSFFATLFKQDREQKVAVQRLHHEVTVTSQRAIANANALAKTIEGLIERKQALDGKPTNGPIPRRS